jgi:hypothetical protein
MVILRTSVRFAPVLLVAAAFSVNQCNFILKKRVSRSDKCHSGFCTDRLFAVPSKPTEVFFPDVDHWSARMVWQKPKKINGILLGYQLIYWRSDDEQTRRVIDNLTELTSSFRAEGLLDALHVIEMTAIVLILDLEKTTSYTFILCAKTRMGCGEPSINRLLTVEQRGK